MVKLYHVSINEYSYDKVDGGLFAIKEEADKFVRKHISDYAEWINMDGKDMFVLEDEYNEQSQKYSIIISVYDMPNLIFTPLKV
tara:strand:+ start:2032 stop:2283 length:252 start_codon:yes stop_codon:yes gene_type:complete